MVMSIVVMSAVRRRFRPGWWGLCPHTEAADTDASSRVGSEPQFMLEEACLCCPASLPRAWKMPPWAGWTIGEEGREEREFAVLLLLPPIVTEGLKVRSSQVSMRRIS